MEGTIWFDMDGTIYPLYKQPNWLERLRAEDETVFLEPMTRKTLPRIRKAIKALIGQGWQVGIITWAPKNVGFEDDYFKKVENAKKKWTREFFPEISENNFFCFEYGVPKASIIPREDKRIHILIDDNKIIRREWRENGKNFLTADANKGFCKILEGMIM